MKQPSPQELREMLALMKEYGVSEPILKSVCIAAAKKMGLHVETDPITGDSIDAFLDAWFAKQLPIPLIPCKPQDLHNAYQCWCLENGLDAQNIVRFGRRITERGIRRVESNVRVIDPEEDIKRAFSKCIPVFHRAVEAYRIKVGG